jgi:hypothetical protein
MVSRFGLCVKGIAAAAPTSAVGLARGVLERASANLFQKTFQKRLTNKKYYAIISM